MNTPRLAVFKDICGQRDGKESTETLPKFGKKVTARNVPTE